MWIGQLGGADPGTMGRSDLVYPESVISQNQTIRIVRAERRPYSSDWFCSSAAFGVYDDIADVNSETPTGLLKAR